MVDSLLNNNFINTDAMAASAQQSTVAIITTTFYALIVFLIIGLIIYWLYKKSFNIRIIVFDNSKAGKVSGLSDHLKGKLVQKRPGEFSFSIFKDKKNKVRYNSQAVSPSDLYLERMPGNKVRNVLCMTYDEKGYLIPVKMESVVQRVPLLDPNTGVQTVDSNGTPQYIEKTHLKSSVDPVDVAWFYKEYDKLMELLDPRSAWDKWGWIIMAVLMVLCIGAFAYNSYTFKEAATALSQASVQVAQAAIMAKNNATIISAAVP